MRRQDLERILRVDQAGEYGAVRIYKGQLAVLKANPALQTMAEHEEEHLKKFNQLLITHKISPTLFQPLWSIAAYGLGVATALAGEKTAHACTIAVETVIDDHYRQQEEELQGQPDYAEVLQVIQECHQDELVHRQIAMDQGGQEAPCFPVIDQVISTLSKAAIWLSSRF